MMYLQLAWRNIWRNRRRSLITMASVMFAVILAIIMKSMITGVWGKMIQDVVSFSSGYIQIHKKGYWAEQSIDNAFSSDSVLFQTLNRNAAITSWSPRLESFSLASVGEKTKGVLIHGIDPDKENAGTKLASKIKAGNYLQPTDHAVMVAEGLAQHLKLKLHDTLILLGQGYHGNMAAAQFPVKAIVHLGVVELNQSMVWMPLQTCQNYFTADSMLTSVSVMLKNNNDMDEVKSQLLALPLAEDYEVMNWKEMMPELDQMVEGDSAAHFLVIYVLYFVISFGIFGTLLMMMNERMHEFGILLAIGMKKHIMCVVTVTEIIIVSMIGVIAGAVVALPVLLYFHQNPITFTGELAKVYEGFGMEAVLPPALQPQIYLSQAYTVFVLVLLLSFYPIYKIMRLKIIQALNS
jgi:ABC-type lipoprotein release transport system permease subunit